MSNLKFGGCMAAILFVGILIWLVAPYIRAVIENRTMLYLLAGGLTLAGLYIVIKNN
jgi:hypothetical protein